MKGRQANNARTSGKRKKLCYWDWKKSDRSYTPFKRWLFIQASPSRSLTLLSLPSFSRSAAVAFSPLPFSSSLHYAFSSSSSSRRRRRVIERFSLISRREPCYSRGFSPSERKYTSKTPLFECLPCQHLPETLLRPTVRLQHFPSPPLSFGLRRFHITVG